MKQMLNLSGGFIHSAVIAIVVWFMGTRNGRRFWLSSLLRFARRFIFYVPIRARIATIAAVLRCPLEVQNAILGAVMGPQGDQLQSILYVEKNNWKGCWISRNILQHAEKCPPLEWAESTAGNADMIIIYLHGGGFRFGTGRGAPAIPEIGMPAQYMDSFLTMFKLFESNHQLSDVRMLGVDYSLSPGVAHPKALYECIGAYRYLVNDLGVSPSHIIIAGDSAGGNLSAAMLLMLKDQHAFNDLSILPPIPLPAGVVLLCPWVVLSSEEPVVTEELITDYIKKTDIEDCIGRYLPQTKNMDPGALSAIIRQPTVSPLYGDFRSMCPLLVAYSTTESLANQIKTFVDKVQKSNADVTVIARGGVAHLWIMEPLLCPTETVWMEDLTKLTDWCAKIVSTAAHVKN